MDPRDWSKAHARCVECGTTDKPHKGHGLCAACYLRRYAADDPARHRERCRAWRQRNRERHLAWSRQYQRAHYWHLRGGQGATAAPSEHQVPG
jgi:hypothetical protein